MRDKKVGIMTFHNSYNCGSMLQCYALQTVLKKLGIRSEVIDFSNEGQQNVYSVFSKNNTIKNIVKNILIFSHAKKIKKNFLSYEEFKNNYFNLTKNSFKNMVDLESLNYDIVITGSDQVWNITIEDGDDAYFLPWLKKGKKIAYAPSFGSKNIIKYSDNIDKYKNYLLDFDYISIRENNGKKWIKELINKDVNVLLDPTLLIDKSDYEKITSTELKLPSKYIFYYSPGFDYRINNLVKAISKKYNLPVIAFNSKNYYVKLMQLQHFLLPKLENPSTYLQLISNATMVITTSFHGTIFSTIFKKNFWTIKNGGMFGEDDRVLTLMENLDLTDRLIDIEFDDNFDYFCEKNFEIYDTNLSELRKKSLQFLNESIVRSLNEE